MSRHRAIICFGRTFTDHDLRRHVRPCLASSPCSRDSKCSSGAQTRNEFALESAAALDVKGLIDGLVTYSHGLIIGEIDFQPPRDLFGTPGKHPGTVFAVGLAPPLPLGRGWPRHRLSIRMAHLARESLLHVVVQRWIRDKLRCLWTLRHEIRLPLRNRGPIVKLLTTGRSIAAQFTRDGRRISTHLPSN